MRVVTARAPVNIAVVKYWGKKDEHLILPLNGSISLTLDPAIMCAKTSVAASPGFAADKLWLNGVECSINARLQRVIEEIKKRASSCSCLLPTNWKIHICSENNFPTAAGLASSAAGLACLAFALARLYDVEGDISDIARLGSGSACRSMYGGFVEWVVGAESNGKDSVARQIADVEHWPNMVALILVVNVGKKHTSSTLGMKTSKETSRLMRHRTTSLVPETLSNVADAILVKDFSRFAELTMKDSNQLHAVCLDSYPPIMYLTDTSRDIIRLVHSINDHFSCNKVAYTFDAGPNACLFLLEDDLPLVASLVKHHFPPTSEANFVHGRSITYAELNQDMLDQINLESHPDGLSYIISTRVGGGPKELTTQESLLDPNTGLPLKSPTAL